MGSELIRMCGLDPRNLSESRYILIREGLHHDATFSLAQFINFMLHNHGTVLFISLNQAKNHYVNVLSKLGIKIKNIESSKQFAYIDGLKYLSDFIKSNGVSRDGDRYQQCLQQFYQMISDSWSQMPPGPSLLLIDGLLTLESVGFTERSIASFVLYLKSLTSDSNGSLLTTVHSEYKDTSTSALVTELAHGADVTLDVDNLSTGYCTEIDGEVICTRQDLSATTPSTQEKMHYHLLATGQVKYIAPGMSTAVL